MLTLLSVTYKIENNMVYKVEVYQTSGGRPFIIEAAQGGLVGIEETETEVILSKAYVAEDASSWWYVEKERIPKVVDDPETPDVNEYDDFMVYVCNVRVPYWQEHDE